MPTPRIGGTEINPRRRKPEETNLFCLFEDLWDVATRKSHGKGYTDGTKCCFSKEEVEATLMAQGIVPKDMTTAIEHCVANAWLERRGNGFHATRGGFANYHAQLRRI